MSYRNDSDALRAQLAIKDAALAKAYAKIDALQGVDTKQKANPFLGAPTKLVLERTFKTALDDVVLEKIVRVLRERSDNLGRMERVGDTVSWTSTPQGNNAYQPLEVIIERRGEETYVRIRERLGQYAGGIFGGLVGGLGGGGVSGVVALSFAIGLSPVAIPMVACAWIGTVFLGARGIYKSVVTRHAKRNAGAMEAIAEIMENAPRVRVRSEPEVSAEAKNQVPSKEPHTLDVETPHQADQAKDTREA